MTRKCFNLEPCQSRGLNRRVVVCSTCMCRVFAMSKHVESFCLHLGLHMGLHQSTRNKNTELSRSTVTLGETWTAAPGRCCHVVPLCCGLCRALAVQVHLGPQLWHCGFVERAKGVGQFCPVDVNHDVAGLVASRSSRLLAVQLRAEFDFATEHVTSFSHIFSLPGPVSPLGGFDHLRSF